MTDANLHEALMWGIRNSGDSESTKDEPKMQIGPGAVAALFAHADPRFEKPISPKEQMENSMAAAKNKKLTVGHRVTALDNLEQIIDQLDQANYMMETKALSDDLIVLLQDEEPEIRACAARCCGVAVQNNIRTQERLLILKAYPPLMRLATEDTDRQVRKSAITALSSAVRNFQPGLDAAVSLAPAEFKPQEPLDAHDMESVDILINKLRDSV
ncbi:Hsp70 nucleotide exchange factor fes1 [Ophiobolus disseminans]|uniref:Hsp70 nucleotide exchange factor fes1 n=1 Tax=Ophiobolus disseminans TaxID=1469910 RepID=A0A6A6ZZR1_9PLEO|nr:Hsp70 nucleotide exchange factor fes1 [Ophiobolus disseminans]